MVVDESSLAIEFRILNHLTIPGGFARVASPKMMSDCHMLRMNVCDASRQARRHAETRKRVDIYKIASMACARALRVQDRLPHLVPPQVCDAGRRDTKKG